MVKNDNYPYYYSVGGRVKFGETSETAVLREVYEETHMSLEIDRLAFIHENFFVDESRSNEPFQEIALFYLMKPHNRIKEIKCNSVGSDGGKESLHWLPIEHLSEYHVFPEFLKSELNCLINGVFHFITKDDITSHAK